METPTGATGPAGVATMVREFENAVCAAIAWATTAAMVIGVVWVLLTSLAYVEAFFGATSYVL